MKKPCWSHHLVNVEQQTPIQQGAANRKHLCQYAGISVHFDKSVAVLRH